MLNNLLQTIHSKDGFIHWCIQRFSAVLALILIFAALTSGLSIVFVIIAINISFHLGTGVCTLLDDYVHGSIEHLVGVTILRITIIFAVKTVFILFI